ncbi:1-acyl-sn-glycerol-3-phosphate acyltransferase [Clostridium sp. CX1]|uniref:1-acyl-sn-glycerol-3-phosphate acyltransferase n=1 Tax=Clostridium tanneri TaxID=3037988 RepID=A0ABU4JQT4_9CLOT|nr:MULTISPECIES: lysophospholipid acyltransferase family protein [unclassified Clostridium]MCT8977451.1 1-acyl-sn-glycerol-3-phosphate acyltransferase [Clostridium sp. CX1]MDW8800518.1 lysophospholipid acyltransferase family protein [Clostridium sp. A1-XYC3]
MIKLFWYTYFSIYLLLTTIVGRTKLFFIRKKSPELAKEYAYRKLQSISNHVLKKSKTTTLIEGKENIPEGPCLFVSNHQAIFDAFLLLAGIDKLSGFIAKKEIEKIPLIGSWLKQIDSVYIDRQNIREGMKAINQGVENLKKGWSMIIFPEGTRSLKSEMGEFKKGSMKLALKAKVPIVPITIDGTYRVLEVGNQVRGHSVKMMIHKPIYLENLSEEDKKNLAEILHDIIESGLK